LDAAQRLKSNGGEEAFALLDRVYGIDGARQGVLKPYSGQSSKEKLSEQATLSGKKYEQVLDAAIYQLLVVMSAEGNGSM
jgi:hypothetical protein